MKKCEIINGPDSYILKVDGLEIRFMDHHAVGYFQDHYRNLGYQIIFIKE